LTGEEKAHGWRLLFDGQETAGWVNRSQTSLKNWEAKDGALTRSKEGGDVVYAKEQFEDFELSLDWKTSGNSGVFVRMSSQEDWLNTGLEIQVLPPGKPSKHSAGALYDLVAPPAEAKVERDGWNNFRIICDGPWVTCSMNGEQTFRIDLRDQRWQIPQGKFNKAYATLPRPGWIMLQDHGAEVAYKNIKVRSLKPWQSLFDGKSLAGWKDSGYAGTGEIRAEDGRLILERGVMTGAHYTNALPRTHYEVSFDAMRVDGSDFFCGLTFPVDKNACSFIVGGWGGGVVGLSSLDGDDAANNDTTRYLSFENGRWYRMQLRVEPDRIQAWIDEDQVVNSVITGRRISIRPEVEPSVPFGFATWSTTGALRDIRIRPL
jgi:hypothetical protein